jgi:peptide/nickel transport system substrate-binding protein
MNYQNVPQFRQRFLKVFFSNLAIILTLFCVLILNGCQTKLLKPANVPDSQLVFTSLSNPTTFNPPLNTSAFNIFGFLYDGLINQNGLTAELEPGLAESWEISENKKQIIFTLREGLKWSDGHPLTADDVVFSYNEVYYNPKIPTGIKDILKIGTSGDLPTVKKLDDVASATLRDRRVEFTVSEPFAPFLRYAGGITILPAHALRSYLQSTDSNGNLAFLSAWGTGTDPKQIIGNGLYRMVSYKPSERIIFERNPYYWRKDAAGKPQPYIENIVLQIIESTDNQLIKFRSGELDSIEVTPDAFSLLKKEEKRGSYTIYNGGPSSDSRFVTFNLSKMQNQQGKPLLDPVKTGWFNTLAFRQAVAYAIDRETMKNNIYRGLGEIQHSALGTQNPYYLSPEEGLKVYEYNPEKAKQLLIDAGFQYNSQQELLDKDGNRVQFNILVKSEEKARVDATVQIQQDLANIGIKTDVQALNFNAILQKLDRRDWECYVGGFSGGGVEPHGGFNIWSSQGSLHQFNQGPQPWEPELKGWEVSDWEKEIDRLFAQGVQELDDRKRKEIYGKFQQIAAEQVPFIYLVNGLSFQAVRDRVQNIKFSALGGAFWNLYELNIAQPS